MVANVVGFFINGVFIFLPNSKYLRTFVEYIAAYMETQIAIGNVIKRLTLIKGLILLEEFEEVSKPNTERPQNFAILMWKPMTR